MKKFSTVASIIAYKTASAYTSDQAGCEAFVAATFTNTGCSAALTSGTILSDSTNISAMTCAKIDGDTETTYCVGESMTTTTNPVEPCTYNTLMCATCADDGSGTIQIRIQSNNMPNKCWQTNTSNPNVANYNAVDFTVYWNMLMKSGDNLIYNYDQTDFID